MSQSAADKTPWTSARLFALLNMSLADGYIASFSVKYGNPFWRPVTAIREAATDGNPATTADPDWTPLDTTPPIPDHDSAHAVQGAAAATVMARIFGTDRVRFQTLQPDPPRRAAVRRSRPRRCAPTAASGRPPGRTPTPGSGSDTTSGTRPRSASTTAGRLPGSSWAGS